jgi:hypothetical protein
LKVLSIVSCRLWPVSFVLALSVAVTLGAQSPRLGRIAFPTSGSAPAQPASAVLPFDRFE